MRDKRTTYRIMSAIKSRNTGPEKLFERELRKTRIRFKKQYPIEGKPDFVILDKKIAIFIDGDFWHGNNWKIRGLKSREVEFSNYNSFWVNKIKRNINRDRRVNRELMRNGWTVIRAWENAIRKDPRKVVKKVINLINGGNVKSKKAIHGEKMVEVHIKFWTNDIAPGKSNIFPKNCWDCGVVVMEKNTLHDVRPKSPVPFHSLSDLPMVIEKVLIQHDFKLHHGSRTKKLYI